MMINRTIHVAYAEIPYAYRIFFECGQCGSMHHCDLPGDIDCRDDSHRFSCDQLDALYGRGKWAEQDDETDRDITEFVN